MHQLVLLGLFVFLFSAPAAAGIGIGFGQPLEERVGGDYGPEYFRDWKQRQTQASQLRPRAKPHRSQGKGPDRVRRRRR
jgi:hypothetical protein